MRTDDGQGRLALARGAAILHSMGSFNVALLEALRYDDRVRVLVITGAGDAFSSGFDLKEMIVDLKDDPAAYDRPERFDVGRFAAGDVPQPLSFGWGAHHCATVRCRRGCARTPPVARRGSPRGRAARRASAAGCGRTGGERCRSRGPG